MSEQKTTPARYRRLSEVENWDLETDVVVVGFGGAGSCAAIEAAEAGSEVILLEASSESGGSTKLSSAEIYMGGNGGTRVQKACGYDDKTEDMITFLTQCAGPQADEAKIRNYCENSVAHFDWLVEKGVPFKDTEHKERAIMALTDDCLLYTGNEKAWPFKENAKPAPRGHNLYVEGDNGGPLFMGIMTENVEKLGIDVRYETRALCLVADEAGEVQGLVIRQNQQEHTVRTRKGVVLCAGGFNMNADMLKRYAPMLTKATEPIGNPGDTGSGIQMGMSVGGAAINMHEGFVSVPYYPPSELTYGIFVNAMGQRFINEDCYHGRVGYHALQQPGDRIYLIASAEGYEHPTWLGADICGTGETIEELEEELGMVPGSLGKTITLYNEHAANGEDPVFHKAPEWLREMKAPYVALDCTPGRGTFYPFFTLGGLDTLPSGEVVTADREVIPGLYAAGRTACGVPRSGAGYCSGISVGDATFSGRMAGKAVAAAASRPDPKS
jgi:succinate dehydrogenase/fumarate reductase flavoprotein subunit